MTLTIEKGRERVEQLERAARSAFGPQILSGMWSEGQIAWKVYLGKERGTFYESTRDDVSEAFVLNMIRAIRDKKSVGTGGSRVDAKADTEIHYVEKEEKKSNWWSRGNMPKKNQIKRTEVVEKVEVVIDEEDRLKAQELGIKTKDINAGGGTRKDENGDSYWLDLKQLIELDELDKNIQDNEEFYAEFAELRKRHGIKASKKRVKWDDHYTSSSSGYMTGWWKGWGDYSSGGSELSRRLAVALGVINTTVQVINNTAKRWRVMLATEEEGRTGLPVSYTSYDEQMVVVSPSALLDTSLDEQMQIEITTGYGLHEASHTEYSESLMKALQKPTPLTPMAVAGMLHNILEDIRIERLTGEKFPGFAGFFDTMNAYLWKVAVSTIKVDGWGPDLTDKINAIIRIAKWPVEFEPEARKDPQMSTEFDWFRNWVDDYISGGLDIRTSVQRALDHLMEDPKTKQQMQNQAAAEAAMGMLKEMAEDAFNQMFGEAMKKLGEKGQLGQPCPSPTSPDKMSPKPGEKRQPMLTAEVGAEVEQLIREEFRVDNPDLPEQFQSQKGHVPEIQVSKPESGTLQKMPPTPLLQRLKYAFRFRKARPMYSNRLMRSGSLDEDEMWRVLSSDTRIFEQRVIEDDPDTQITMLIDSSGSMIGDNIERASFLARIMLECLKDMKGVRCRVRSHSSSYHPGTYKGTSTVFRIWEPGDDIERVQVAKRVGMSGNYDAYAIAWCCDELLKNQRPGEDMVLFVLSDGRPNAAGLAGMDGIKEVRTMVDHFTKKGVTIIQIAIDRNVGETFQRQMYDHYIRYLDDQSLPGQLTNMLIKLFSAND